MDLLLNTYRAILQYSGTDYKGFQKQNSGVPTIQNTLEDVLKKISSGKELKTIGSGRTDTGVHANYQVIKISMNFNIPARGLKKAINDLLPPAIRIKDLSECEDTFHPIHHAINKEYRYRFTFSQYLDPSLNKYCTNIFGDLDIKLMQDFCKLYVGTHDFINYQTMGTDVESTIREIKSCEINPCNLHSMMSNTTKEVFELRIVGTGFLKQMVRLIMGALFEAGKGRVDSNAIKSSLLGGELKNRLGPVAPPQGLVLYYVKYPDI